MSWCRIGLPTEENAPIPLYGGMPVPLSERCGLAKAGEPKPLVFAVLVNPSVLQQSGKTAENSLVPNLFVYMFILDVKLCERLVHNVKERLFPSD